LHFDVPSHDHKRYSYSIPQKWTSLTFSPHSLASKRCNWHALLHAGNEYK
jgi:hypothetical protein